MRCVEHGEAAEDDCDVAGREAHEDAEDGSCEVHVA